MIARTAKEARRLGLSTYFTGKPCPKGHVAERRTGNRGCVVCDKQITNEYCKRKYREDIDAEREYRQQHYRQNKEAYKANAKRQRDAGYGRIWWERNKGYWNFLTAQRRVDIKLRTPKWTDLKEIEKFYRECPEGYTVDHIIPLKGKTVSGLHVIGNLQYLTKSENSKKNNVYDPAIYPEQSC